MTLAIVGSRTFDSYSLLVKEVRSLALSSQITEIVSGGARGADHLAKLYAIDNRLRLTEHYPEWQLYGKRAGFKRNRLIIQDADIVIAFWDGMSRGTLNSINISKELGKELHIIRYREIALLNHISKEIT